MDEVFEIHGVGPSQNNNIRITEGVGVVTLTLQDGEFSRNSTQLSPAEARYLATKLRRLAWRADCRP